MRNLLLFILVFLLAWLGVGIFRMWSEKRSILDVPNERSSHDVATPVGGGLVIVILTVTPLFVYEMIYGGELKYWGFYVGGLMIAAISWFDDIRPVPAFLRFAVHIIAALLAVAQIGAFTEITVWPGNTLGFGFLGPLISILWIVWLTNAYNFMDGIDGLAGVQAVVASAGWALFSWHFGIDLVLFMSIAVLASSLGFLIHNWPPAKVFMGDVGSAFLGYTFAVIPLIAIDSRITSVRAGWMPVVAAGFLWLFLSDTVLTLLRRAFSGERIWDAHRKHLYQSLIKSGYSHLGVTVLYGVLMIFSSAAVMAEIYTGVFGPAAIVCGLVFVIIAVLVGRTSLNPAETE